MKKIMTILASTAMLCAVDAANGDALTTTGFETAGYVAGQNLSTTNDDYGNASGAPSFAGTWVPLDNLEDGVAVVTNYGGAGAAVAADVAAATGVEVADLGSNYLKLDSAPLISRYAVQQDQDNFDPANPKSVDIGNGLYIDTLVQFTAADPETAPETADGDKLCIWLAENEQDPTQCTLMITAGFVNDFYGAIVPTNYETEVKLANNSWHRLQVKALAAVDSDQEEDAALGDGFVVKIDDVVVATTACPLYDEAAFTLNPRAARYLTTGSYKLFPSLVPMGGAGEGTITSLSFKGSGAVDNLSFSQGNDIDPILIAAADMPHANTPENLVFNGEDPVTGAVGNLTGTAYEFDENNEFTGLEGGEEFPVQRTTVCTLLPGYAWTNGTFDPTSIVFTVTSSGGGESGFDGGDGSRFNIDSTTQTALEAVLPSGKTLADTADAASGMTYAQAYALGLLNETTGDVEELDATITVGADGKVKVSLNANAKINYVVTLKVFEKASLTAAWPVEATHTYDLGSSDETAGFTPGSVASGFYKVEVSISNRPSN